MKKIYLFIALCVCTALPLQAGNGESLFSFLNISPSARATAMGDAFIAVADDASATYFNPAGLAHIYTPQLSIMHLEYIELTKFESFAYVYPIRKAGTLGIAVSYLNYGSMDIMKEDALGYYDPADSGSFSSYDAVASVSYSRFIIFDSLSAGVTAKYIKEKIDTSTLAGSAFDAGLLWKTPVSFLTAGVNLNNMGPAINSDPLPSSLNAGILSTWNTFHDHDLRIAADIRLPFDDASTAYHIGVEYLLADYATLRAGYKIGYDIGNYTAGLSLELFRTRTTRTQLHYAYAPFNEFGDTHKISISMDFGKLRSYQ